MKVGQAFAVVNADSYWTLFKAGECPYLFQLKFGTHRLEEEVVHVRSAEALRPAPTVWVEILMS